MSRFLIRRVLGALVILLIISAITFWLFYAIPRDPAMMSCGKNCTPDMLAQIRHNLGIDHPIPVQYWDWLKGVFVGRDYGSFGNCNAPASATPSPTASPSSARSWTACRRPSRSPSARPSSS